MDDEALITELKLILESKNNFNLIKFLKIYSWKINDKKKFVLAFRDLIVTNPFETLVSI